MARLCILAFLVALVASACGGGASICPIPVAPEAGTERGACRPDGTCNAGLACLSDLCVNPNPEASGDVVQDATGDATGDAEVVEDAAGETPIGDPGFLGTCTDAAPVQWKTIPGGTFPMGAEDVDKTTLPVHDVTVAAFGMTLSEVTVCQFQSCVLSGRCTAPTATRCGRNWGVDGSEDHPVNCVTWDQSAAFCGWAGGRLCTEAEWEYAARNGSAANLYPWGDAAPTCADAVFNGSGMGCPTNGSESVCSKAPDTDTWGVCGLAGDASEWVEDDYHKNYTGAPADGSAWIDNPRSDDRVVRGDNFLADVVHLRSSSRDYDPAASPHYQVGVRCCKNGPH